MHKLPRCQGPHERCLTSNTNTQKQNPGDRPEALFRGTNGRPESGKARVGERTPSPPPGLPSGMLLGPRGGVTLRSERFGDLGFTWLAGFVRRSVTNCSGMQTPDISGGGERLRRGPVTGLELNFHSAGETGENLRVSFSAHPPFFLALISNRRRGFFVVCFSFVCLFFSFRTKYTNLPCSGMGKGYCYAYKGIR